VLGSGEPLYVADRLTSEGLAKARSVLKAADRREAAC